MEDLERLFNLMSEDFDGKSGEEWMRCIVGCFGERKEVYDMVADYFTSFDTDQLYGDNEEDEEESED